MAKRLTDTEKWNDDWYVALNNDYRIIWQWLLDNCSHAGICKRNMKLMNVMCNTSATEDDMIKMMENRVLAIKNDWFIPKFLKFQYSDLQSNRPVIISVRKELIRKNYYTLIPPEFGNDYLIIPESLDNDYRIIKDKDKDKDSLTKQKSNGHAKDFRVQREENFLAGVKERAAKANGY